MTGIILALAGLASGDGGPGMGAAAAPVAVGLGGDWTGAWEIGHGEPLRVQMRQGVISWLGQKSVVQLKFRRGPDRDAGTLAAVMSGDKWSVLGQGIYRAEPGRLLICVDFLHGEPPPSAFRPVSGRTALITLKPAALRKP
jgi:hypothetical protein